MELRDTDMTWPPKYGFMNVKVTEETNFGRAEGEHCDIIPTE
jgi:hypothetical protein